MWTALALALLLLAVAALLGKAIMAFCILGPLAWLAMRRATYTPDDLGAFMGVCLMACVVGVVIDYALFL